MEGFYLGLSHIGLGVVGYILGRYFTSKKCNKDIDTLKKENYSLADNSRKLEQLLQNRVNDIVELKSTVSNFKKRSKEQNSMIEVLEHDKSQLEQNYAELERDKEGFKAAWLKVSKELTTCNEELAKSMAQRALSKTKAKDLLSEAKNNISFHESNLKGLELEEVSKEVIDKYLVDNPDESDINLMNEMTGYMKWIGVKESMEKILKVK